MFDLSKWKLVQDEGDTEADSDWFPLIKGPLWIPQTHSSIRWYIPKVCLDQTEGGNWLFIDLKSLYMYMDVYNGNCSITKETPSRKTRNCGVVTRISPWSTASSSFLRDIYTVYARIDCDCVPSLVIMADVHVTLPTRHYSVDVCKWN